MNFLNWLSQSSDLIIAVTALIAVITSAISIYLTYRTLRDQRTHNQISVKPIAHLSKTDSVDKLSIRIENRGIGPLIIYSFKVINDVQESTSLRTLLPPLPNGFAFEEDFDRTAILPGKFLNLIEFTPNFPDLTNSHDVPSRDKILKALSKITIKITYSDIYGKQMLVGEWPLQYFGKDHN